MSEQLVVILNTVGCIAVTVWIRESGPARITHCSAFRASPTEICPADIVIEETVGLIFVDDGFYVRAHAFGIVRTSIKPDHKKFSITGTEFGNHFFAQVSVPYLAVAGKFAFSFRLEIMDT